MRNTRIAAVIFAVMFVVASASLSASAQAVAATEPSNTIDLRPLLGTNAYRIGGGLFDSYSLETFKINTASAASRDWNHSVGYLGNIPALTVGSSYELRISGTASIPLSGFNVELLANGKKQVSGSRDGNSFSIVCKFDATNTQLFASTFNANAVLFSYTNTSALVIEYTEFSIENLSAAPPVPPAYFLTPGSGTGGGISPSVVQSVEPGSSQTFTITPDPGYKIKDVKVDGVSVGAVSSYTFNNVQASRSISAEFISLNAIDLRALLGSNAYRIGGGLFDSYSPETFKINTGSAASRDWIHSVGYLGNIPALTVGSTYKLRISGTSSVPLSGFNVELLANGKKQISGSKSGNSFSIVYEFDATSPQLFANTPNATAVLFSYADPIPLSIEYTEFSIEDISAPPPSYILTPSSGTGGGISPAVAQSVMSGGSQTFTITPDPGYKIKDVKVDGVSVGAVSSYTFDDVQADATIEAIFEIVSVDPPPGGEDPPPGGEDPPPGGEDPPPGGGDPPPGGVEGFLNIMSICLDFFRIPLNMYSFTFSLLDVFVVSMLCHIVVRFIRGVF